MTRRIFDKVMWMARATTTVVGLAIMLALVLGVATTAFGANGNNFILGSINNAATAITKLTGNVDGPAMQVVNNNADANDTALDLRVQSGEAPMRVNSPKKVANLNADKVDGLDSSQLRGATAYARVLPGTSPSFEDPSFDSSRTSGFTAVERIDIGVFCLTPANGINPVTRPAVVSVDWHSTGLPKANAAASYNADPRACGDGRYQVVTERIRSDGFDTGANNIGFIVTVP